MNIENELLPGEELLYQSKSNPKNVNKHIGVFIFLMLFIIGCLSIAAMSGNIMAFIMSGIMFLAFIPYFILMYKQVKQINKAKNYTYFITTKRIIIYKENQEVYIKNILEIKSIQYTKEKENYGLLKLYVDLDFSEAVNNTYNGIANRVVTMFKSSVDDDKIVFLIGIENPDDAITAIKTVNPNISVYS